MFSALNTLVAAQLFSFLMVFARVGSAVFVMPAIGDSSLPRQHRLYIGLSLSLILTPFLSTYLPEQPPTGIAALILFIISEITIGIFIGAVARTILAALNVAGFLISHSTQLANTFVFNPQMAAQGSVIGSFISLFSIAFIFATGLHHMLILAIVNSYELFTPLQPLIIGDFTQVLVWTLNKAFRVGIQISAPMLVVSLTLYFSVGLVARLIPTIQVFFMMLPLKISVGFVTFLLSFGAIIIYFFEEFEEVMTMFL